MTGEMRVIPVPPEDAEGWRPIPHPDSLLGVDASTMRAFLAFQAAVDAHARLVLKDLCQGGTEPSQITFLRVIATYEGLCQKEIADILKISRARVTTVLNSLAKMGAIKRVRDEKDRRLTHVYLTDFGREIDQRKEALRAEHICTVFGSMSEEEREELHRSLGAVTGRILSLIEPAAATARGDTHPDGAHRDSGRGLPPDSSRSEAGPATIPPAARHSLAESRR